MIVFGRLLQLVTFLLPAIVDSFYSDDRRMLFTHYMARHQPCSANCDERIFPHCTQSCKCDYDYPRVQRFCNPPPLPLFLNTCRLWYNQCPKYERYHYASQYIYSKAEKGKVLPGIVQPSDSAAP